MASLKVLYCIYPYPRVEVTCDSTARRRGARGAYFAKAAPAALTIALVSIPAKSVELR
jgi:hypothetical protein